VAILHEIEIPLLALFERVPEIEKEDPSFLTKLPEFFLELCFLEAMRTKDKPTPPPLPPVPLMDLGGCGDSNE
jgi:hypothetical protein